MEYHIVACGLLQMEEVSEALTILGKQGWRVAFVTPGPGIMCWTLERPISGSK